MNRKLTVIFGGSQGSGKGTQVELLKSYLLKIDPSRPVLHFEMGKSLRKLAEAPSYTGRFTREILGRGELIPYAVSASVFSQYLIEHIQTNDEHLIIDGFPRTAAQVHTVDSALIEFYKRPSPVFLSLNISDDEAVKRLLLRGRHDDSEENILKRLDWSREQTIPTIELFRKNPAYRVCDINGEQSVEQVRKDIMSALSLPLHDNG